jgi:hypothetical protein
VQLLQVAAAAALNWPALQVEHTVAPVPAYVPAAQFEQLVAPADAAKLPPAQLVHAAAPVLPLDVPAAHAVHAADEVAPGLGLYLPAAQPVGFTAPVPQ